jgi:predicted N-acetyltransferase YhbS
VVEVREATPADARAVAEVHIRSWRSAYQGLVAQQYLDALNVEDRAERFALDRMEMSGPYTLVAVDGDTIRGHVTIGRCRDDDLAGSGEIWALFVDPRSWVAGIGRALVTAGCDRLRTAGHESASLWVLSANAGARRFYERTGWRADGHERTRSLGDSPVDEARYVISLRSQP